MTGRWLADGRPAFGRWICGLWGWEETAGSMCEPEGRILIGPRRALPLCAAGRMFPGFLPTLREFHERQGKKSRGLISIFLLWSEDPDSQLSRYEKALFDALDGNILHRDRIAEQVGLFVSLDRLVALGFVAEVTFTPTDLLHAKGDLRHFRQRGFNSGRGHHGATNGNGPGRIPGSSG